MNIQTATSMSINILHNNCDQETIDLFLNKVEDEYRTDTANPLQSMLNLEKDENLIKATMKVKPEWINDKLSINTTLGWIILKQRISLIPFALEYGGDLERCSQLAKNLFTQVFISKNSSVLKSLIDNGITDKYKDHMGLMNEYRKNFYNETKIEMEIEKIKSKTEKIRIENLYKAQQNQKLTDVSFVFSS